MWNISEYEIHEYFLLFLKYRFCNSAVVLNKFDKGSKKKKKTKYPENNLNWLTIIDNRIISFNRKWIRNI